MKRLYLLRHAKSSWSDPALVDHDRPLAGRGRRAAKAIGRHMSARGIEPELVLCSTARRARETLDRIEPALGKPDIRIEAELYAASADALLDRVRSVPDGVGSVLVIGHNPGLQELAVGLASPADAQRELEAKFPTAALVTLAVPRASWRALDWGTAKLVDFVRPRELDRK
jgi:phosphohistidine phosphatase